MTADASGVIVDTSFGKRDTEQVLMQEHAPSADRAKTALLMR